MITVAFVARNILLITVEIYEQTHASPKEQNSNLSRQTSPAAILTLTQIKSTKSYLVL